MTIRDAGALALLVFLIVPTHAKTIYDDGGGYLIDYDREVAQLIIREESRIMGPCHSACTVHLANPKVCVGRSAKLYFHSVWGGNAQRGNRYLMEIYPPSIRAWIERNGGLTRRDLVLRGKELRKLVRSCK